MSELAKRSGRPGVTPLERLFREIRQRAPQADVLVLGYPRFFSSGASHACANSVGFRNRQELHWVNSKVSQLNTIIRRSIRGLPKFQYVDVEHAFAGNELCSGRPPMMHGIVKTERLYSFHPKAAGQARLAEVVADYVRGSRQGTVRRP
ncbi:MAG: hypothetical protein LC808_31045 [Actinobacteria bacterium]|nr:hypothetical protein [Actinomycetota bacterium]